MISGLNIDIYQALFQQKKLTEKYIGKVEFDWVYSEVHYTAECTVGVPFDLFDKTIVGILLVDDFLSIEEIGDILGMNVIHNPENQQYRDNAEFDILRMAIDNLCQYKMIEIGDTSYSSCRLTSIGREYAQKGRKFKIESNKPFSLVYDHTGQNHIEAKSLFKNLKGKNQSSLVNDFNFIDESLMKQIVVKQSSEVYNEEKGNSFTNPQIHNNKSQSFSLELFVALLYDLENGSIRLLAYEPITKTINKYFTNWLNEHKLEEIIEQFQSENTLKDTLPTLSQEYIQSIVEKQNNFEKEIDENPSNALAIAKGVNQTLSYIDIEYFWNNLNEFVTKDTKECWFFVPEPNGEYLSLIEKFAEDCPHISVFLSINTSTKNEANFAKQISNLIEKSSLLNNNLFMIPAKLREIEKFKFWKLENSLLEYNECCFSIGKEICFNSISKSQTDISETIYKSNKSDFAKEVLPLFNESLLQAIQEKHEEKNINKSVILSYQNLDKKALIFTDLQEYEDILQQAFRIGQLKDEFTDVLKEAHLPQIQSKLQVLLEDFEKQELTKLEPLQEFKSNLQIIQDELLEDYKTLQEEVTAFENKLKVEENRIKDEILAKTYIIDTNVFIEEPEIISKIDIKHSVVLSHTVINELDKLKQKDKIKEKASKAISGLNKLLGKSKQLRTAKAKTTILSEDYQQNSPDNRILSVAFMYKDKNPILLTSDNGLQLKAKSISIPTISLKEFLGEKQELKAVKLKNDGIDYAQIFKQIDPDKNGKIQISHLIKSLKIQDDKFDYKELGFDKAWKFVESLGCFEIQDRQFITLKK
jgi:rRNA-processing protein FCF1